MQVMKTFAQHYIVVGSVICGKGESSLQRVRKMIQQVVHNIQARTRHDSRVEWTSFLLSINPTIIMFSAVAAAPSETLAANSSTKRSIALRERCVLSRQIN
jgi:hypothetical protein